MTWMLERGNAPFLFVLCRSCLTFFDDRFEAVLQLVTNGCRFFKRVSCFFVVQKCLHQSATRARVFSAAHNAFSICFASSMENGRSMALRPVLSGSISR